MPSGCSPWSRLKTSSPGTNQGSWRIARKVAKDRVISTVDPEARHGHKSVSVRKDGFKAHICIEPDTGIVTAAKITPANHPDGPDAHFYLTDGYHWCPLGAMFSRPRAPHVPHVAIIPGVYRLDSMTFQWDVYRPVLRLYPPSSAMTTERVQAQERASGDGVVAAVSSNWTHTRLPSRRTTLPRRDRSSSSPTVTMSAGWGSKSGSFARGLWEIQHSTTRSPPTSLGS